MGIGCRQVYLQSDQLNGERRKGEAAPRRGLGDEEPLVKRRGEMLTFQEVSWAFKCSLTLLWVETCGQDSLHWWSFNQLGKCLGCSLESVISWPAGDGKMVACSTDGEYPFSWRCQVSQDLNAILFANTHSVCTHGAVR